MKVMFVNGSSHLHGTTMAAIEEMEKVFRAEGIETEVIQVGGKPIADCLQCNVCGKTGKCVFTDDGVNEFVEKAKDADGFVFATPVYFAHPSGRIFDFLDRAFYSSNGYENFKFKPGAAVAIARRGGTTASLDALNKYFGIAQMPTAGSTYWNMVHGLTAEDAPKDEEGMQTMRNLAKNMICRSRQKEKLCIIPPVFRILPTSHKLWKVCRKQEELFYMKATGIVRRIDDLGRIVIPKEIRRTLRIREADPLEIFTDREGEIILKKYSPIGEMTTFARQYAESLAQVSGHTVLIADRDQFIAAAGGCRNLIGKPLSREMEQQIESRQIVLATRGDRTFVQIAPEGVEEYVCEAISPINCEGDVIGAVVLLGQSKTPGMGEVERKLIQSASGFLGRQMGQ